MKPKLNVAVFCTPEVGHFAVLLPVVERLVRAELGVFVFSHRRFEPSVSAVGAKFVEAFEDERIERVDPRSRPVPCRYVSLAPHHAVELANRLRELEVRLIVYETFCVSAVVCAKLLGLPRVNVFPSHNPNPRLLHEQLRGDPRVSIADECHEAVLTLRRRFGIEEASPFWYVDASSDVLNLHCEPPEFLTDSERAVFEPAAFFGSLSDRALDVVRGAREPGSSALASQPSRWFRSGASTHKLYVAFGTVVSRYYQAEVTRLLEGLAELARARPELDVVVSHKRGDGEVGDWSSLTLWDQVDQWEVLGEADLFLTHHGVGSTHESIAHGVPMLSYPFFWDQPALAKRCRELGVALPLVDAPRAPASVQALDRALQAFDDQRESLRRGLERAREWEANVIRARSDVVRRLIDLA